MPAVESATMANAAVLVGRDTQVSLPGRPEIQSLHCSLLSIGPRYFDTVRIPFLRGRDFDSRDNVQSPHVAIVSDALARRLWPSGAAVGATVLVDRRPYQVVGIATDVSLQTRGSPLLPFVYTAFWQSAAQVDASLAVRVKGDPGAMLPALARELSRVDPDVPVAETVTLASQIGASLQSERITAGFVSFAAVLAILLTGVGLYGALAFAVSRRTREIGIRIAVGAQAAGVLAMVIREGMTVVLAGIALGLGLALASVRMVRHLLYGSGSADAQIYVAAALVVAGAGLIACWFPARRAASIEPITALRDQ